MFHDHQCLFPDFCPPLIVLFPLTTKRHESKIQTEDVGDVRRTHPLLLPFCPTPPVIVLLKVLFARSRRLFSLLLTLGAPRGIRLQHPCHSMIRILPGVRNLKSMKVWRYVHVQPGPVYPLDWEEGEGSGVWWWCRRGFSSGWSRGWSPPACSLTPCRSRTPAGSSSASSVPWPRLCATLCLRSETSCMR